MASKLHSLFTGAGVTATGIVATGVLDLEHEPMIAIPVAPQGHITAVMALYF